ncbi:MAG: hypothetical protein K2Q18_10925 [Bdellovibrionales bacterium]|nr:hypothetical protein [Bdellovibrionales bacterium]
MKKFNFSFKFLDRFRKSSPKEHDLDAEVQPEDIEDGDSEEIMNDFKEMPRRSGPSSSINEEANELFSKPSNDINFSDENPELFAEKTLSNYHVDSSLEVTPENLEALAVQELKEKTNPNYRTPQFESSAAFAEEIESIDLPEKPEAASRFKIKFPKFGRSSSSEEKIKQPSGTTKKKLKERLSGASFKSIDKFNWNDFVLKVFSPYSRGKVHGIFVILLVVTFTYLLGKGIALFIGRSTPMVASVKSNISIPPQKADTSSQDINRIASTNLFNVKESDKTEVKIEKKDIASIICIDAEKPTSEPLKLLDTIVLQDSVKSVASVQVRGSGDLVNVREGEQLNNAVEVTKINRMKLILKNLNTGDCEYIASEGAHEDMPLPPLKVYSPAKAKGLFKSSNPSIKNTGNSFKIKRQFRDKLIGNMSEVLTQAKAIQITNPDGSLAFKMTEVVPGSIYSNLDIQNDDIITSINGKKIENLNELMTLLGRIKEIDQFQIGRTRNGMSENLEFGFE